MDALSHIFSILDRKKKDICEVMKNRIYAIPLNVTIVTHKRIHNNKTYTWIEKRVTIPNNWSDNTVYVMHRKDYENLVKLLNLLRDYCKE